MKLVFDQISPGQSTFLEPTADLIISAFDRLDNDIWPGFELTIEPHGFFQIYGGDRVCLTFSTFRAGPIDPTYRRGDLIDPLEAQNDTEVEISFSGQMTWMPVRLTVPKQYALEVVLYFIEHKAFPDDLIWRET